MNAPMARLIRDLALGTLLGIAGLSAAQAFDIPTPANQPSAQSSAMTATQPHTQEPIVPLPPTEDLVSASGAGELPEGVTVETDIAPTAGGLLVRAPFLVTLTILDRTRSLTDHSLHRPHGDAFVTRRISIDQKLVNLNGRLVNRYVYRFAVTPLQPGSAVLSFAEMTFRTVGSGETPYTFMPVARQLSIRPLPGYWPEYLPVAPKLSIQADALPPLSAGQPVDWHLRVTGEGLTEQALQKMLDEQLLSPAHLRVGTPEIRLATDTPVPADDRLAETYSIRIPLLPAPAGQDTTEAKLPDLRLPYLDSRAVEPGQQLRYATLAPQTLHWAPSTGQRVLGGIGYWWWRTGVMLLLLYAGAYGIRDLRRRWTIRQHYRAAQARLAACADPQALLRTLRQETGLPSLGRMIDQAPNPRFMAAVKALDRLCYRPEGSTPDQLTRAESEFPSVRDELVRWLPRVFFQTPPPPRNR